MADVVPNAQPATVSCRKRYVPPILIKGPVLSTITLRVPVSGASAAPCWVARAAFGEADIRWMIFRAWLFENAPAWFRAAYLRYGQTFGGWLTGRDRARAVVRAAMMPAVRRKASI